MKPYLLLLVIAFALFVHGGAIFFVHGYRLPPSSLGGKAYMENQKAPLAESGATRQEEILRRNEQLAALFYEMAQPQPLPEPSPAPLLDKVEIKPKIDLEKEQEGGGIETGFALEVDSPQKFSTLAEADPQQANVDLLFPSDEHLANELIQATEMAQGTLEPSQDEWKENIATLKAGSAEGTLLGNSLQNRSGNLHEGQIDTLLGGGPLLSDLSGQVQSHLNSFLLPLGNQGPGHGFSSLGKVASSDDFTLEVEVAPRIGSPGYLFRAELVPKPSVQFRRIVQNSFFLIDRSHSITPKRYEHNKQAVAKALDWLQPGDTFNILVFDDRVNTLAPHNLPVNPSNIARARQFLSQLGYGGIFATTDLYSSLGRIVPSAVAENEVNTALLLSDGDTFLGAEKQRRSIGKWTKQNAGKVSLYCLASGRGNNLTLMEILSSLNKGLLRYTRSDSEMENTLTELMQALRNPIGKEMSLSAVLPSNMTLTLYPQTVPNLYEHSPFVVYGVVNRLQDFNLFFQGKYYERTLDIHQLVAFDKAKPANAAELEKKIALFESFAQYYKKME